MQEDLQQKFQAGQRASLINSYSKMDLSDLSPMQVLEYILYFVYPRGDVSALAFKLLERFGNVQNVLEADEASLMQIEGVNERSAKMITGFVKIFDYYMNSKMTKRAKVSSWNEIYDTCEGLVRFQSREVLYIIAYDSTLRKIAHRKLGIGTSMAVMSQSNAICDFINQNNASFIVLTHNHPGGNCSPSLSDKNATEHAKDIAKMLHCKLLDHAVVGLDGIYSLEFNKKVRSFVNTEDVKHLAKIYSEI